MWGKAFAVLGPVRVARFPRSRLTSLSFARESAEKNAKKQKTKTNKQTNKQKTEHDIRGESRAREQQRRRKAPTLLAWLLAARGLARFVSLCLGAGWLGCIDLDNEAGNFSHMNTSARLTGFNYPRLVRSLMECGFRQRA